MKDFPLIKFVLFFIAGIIAAKILFISSWIILSLAAPVIIMLLFINRSVKSSNFTLLFFLLPFITGMLLKNSSRQNPQDFLPQSFYLQKDFTAFGEIINIELPGKNEVKFLCRTDSIRFNGSTFNRNVKIICTLKYKTVSEFYNTYRNLKPGYSISLTGTYRKGRECRNPGEFDYNNYLNENGISGILSSYEASRLVITGREVNIFKNFFFSCRNYLNTEIMLLHNRETASILKGLLLADQSDIDYETKTNFVNSGVIHVLAVSGLHVFYVSLIFVFLTGRLNIYFRSALIALSLLFFMYLTGAVPSVVRSVIMALVIIAGFLFNRSTNIYNSLSLAAFIILVINPDDLFNAGFQLSFTAVLSIAVLYPFFRKEIDKVITKPVWVKKIILFSLLSFSAQAGTLPFTLFYFNKLSLAAIPVNLLIIPLSGVIIGSGIFTLLLGIISFPAALIAASFTELLNCIFLYSVNRAGSLDLSYIFIRQFSLLDGFIFYFFLAFTGYSWYRINKVYTKLIFLPASFACIILLCSLDNIELLPEGELSVMMIDVGQGDASLVKLPDGKTALIDAGDATADFDNGERVIIPLLDRLGIEKVDYGFISHMDSDHYSGFVSLIHNKRIKIIYKPEGDTSVQHDVRFERFVKKEEVPLRYYKSAEIIKSPSAVYSILNRSSKKLKTMNDMSTLLKIVYDNTSILFTGDAGKNAEKYYTYKYSSFLNSDILKVSHHGSKTASSEIFLKTVNPSVALISAGIKNKFNLPSQEVLLRLKSINAAVYRTDEAGAVIFRSDGKKFTNINWR